MCNLKIGFDINHTHPCQVLNVSLLNSIQHL